MAPGGAKHCIFALQRRMTARLVNSELDGIWKRVVVAELKALFRLSSEPEHPELQTRTQTQRH